MAEPITKDELLALPVQDIELQNGDLFFCSGNKYMSRVIKGFTRSIWSHCGIVWIPCDVDEPLFIEASKGQGVRTVCAAKYTTPVNGVLYDGPVVIARYISMSPYEAVEVIRYALSMLTESYNSKDIIRIGWQILFSRHRHPKASSWICSDLVSASLGVIGRGIRTNHKYVTPADLWESPAIRMLGRIA